MVYRRRGAVEIATFGSDIPFGREERNGMEWKNKNILRIFFPFPCLKV